MGIVILCILVLLLCFAIAALAIGKVTHDLANSAPESVFSVQDAVGWISPRLDFAVSSQLSEQDVHNIVRWHIDWLDQQTQTAINVQKAAKGQKSAKVAKASQAGSKSDLARTASDQDDELVIVDDESAVIMITKMAQRLGVEYSQEQILAVLDGELAYMGAIGALGPIVDVDQAI